jgi:hypothetical protein
VFASVVVHLCVGVWGGFFLVVILYCALGAGIVFLWEGIVTSDQDQGAFSVLNIFAFHWW